VRGGHWAHGDASGVGERRQLSRFLLVLLFAGAVLAVLAAQPLLAVQLALAAALVLAAILAARWCKLSLHLAFAVYAAALLAPVSWIAAAALLLLAALLAWSRLRLARHAPRDVVAGALAGLAAGALAWQLPFGGQG
jgi:membrane-associated phospholipid phosphatase